MSANIIVQKAPGPTRVSSRILIPSSAPAMAPSYVANVYFAGLYRLRIGEEARGTEEVPSNLDFFQTKKNWPSMPLLCICGTRVWQKMNTLLDDLREEIKKKQVLIVVGAGVSISATNNHSVASWTGLLQNGVDRCLDLQLPLSPGWADRIRAEINSEDMDELLSAATKITSKLKAHGGEFSRWLRETVGSLSLCNKKLVETIAAFDLPIITTNYDSLLEEGTGLPPITWQKSERWQLVVRGADKGIFHLHGFWDEADSIVLGSQSYDQILRSQFTQALLREGCLSRTLLFNGCETFSSLRNIDIIVSFVKMRQQRQDKSIVQRNASLFSLLGTSTKILRAFLKHSFLLPQFPTKNFWHSISS